ncbi:ComEA family DNA-binding protein [Agreia sp.]|uniref:ComEA family DNA-binding protein n=1 Tax=Agreia sp. TaxID=1872416 RepID=UPI0035BBF40A
MDAETPPARARLGIGVGAGIVLVLVVLVVAVLVSALAPRGSSEVLVTNPNAGTSESPPDVVEHSPDANGSAGAPVIFVHVLGSVAKPGLYELRDGARVVDAVAAAGGYTAQADQAQLNLARLVSDGEQLYAPAVGEVPPVPVDGAVATPGDSSSSTVDLNTADSAALETLPRIGPETAKKIIDYRDEHGPFTSIDQLLEVPGIGQKTLDGLRESAVV